MGYRGAHEVREDIYAMFRGMPDSERPVWGEALTGGPVATEQKLAEASGQYGCRQETESDNVLWLNARDEVEAMFSPVDERDIEAVRAVYETISRIDCPLTFILTGKGNVRYLYVASRKTYMQFGYWLAPAGVRPGGPGDQGDAPGLDSVLRTELCHLFDRMEQEERNGWTRAMSGSTADIISFFGKRASRYGCKQKIDGDHILWLDSSQETELLFRVVNDPTTVIPFLEAYEAIGSLNPKAACIIVQKVFVKNGTYDVFRLSASESYLDHHEQLYIE